MASQTPPENLQIFKNSDITIDLIDQTSTLFSQNYGTWGPQGPKAGERIRMSAKVLKEQILPQYQCERSRDYRLVRMLVDGEVVGHVFGCYWVSNGGRICWVRS